MSWKIKTLIERKKWGFNLLWYSKYNLRIFKDMTFTFLDFGMTFFFGLFYWVTFESSERLANLCYFELERAESSNWRFFIMSLIQEYFLYGAMINFKIYLKAHGGKNQVLFNIKEWGLNLLWYPEKKLRIFQDMTLMILYFWNASL